VGITNRKLLITIPHAGTQILPQTRLNYPIAKLHNRTENSEITRRAQGAYLC